MRRRHRPHKRRTKAEMELERLNRPKKQPPAYRNLDLLMATRTTEDLIKALEGCEDDKLVRLPHLRETLLWLAHEAASTELKKRQDMPSRVVNLFQYRERKHRLEEMRDAIREVMSSTVEGSFLRMYLLQRTMEHHRFSEFEIRTQDWPVEVIFLAENLLAEEAAQDDNDLDRWRDH